MNRIALPPLLAAAAVLLTACELGGDKDRDKDKEALEKTCAGAPAALHTHPALPGTFPDAKGIVYTGVDGRCARRSGLDVANAIRSGGYGRGRRGRATPCPAHHRRVP
jgi:hypothetical protein